MMAWVCARCEAMVTTDSRMPTTPTKSPTRRVLGSSACSGLTSISGMLGKSSYVAKLFDDMQPRIGARDAEHAAADHFDDLTERRDIGDEFADFGFRAGEFDDVARWV